MDPIRDLLERAAVQAQASDYAARLRKAAQEARHAVPARKVESMTDRLAAAATFA